jgi:hypothetical protein
MLEQGRLSSSSEKGMSVVIQSGYGSTDEKEVLNNHSDELISKSGIFLGAIVLRRPTSESICEVIRDPDVANIAFIGHGSFSTFYYGRSRENRTPLSWQGISNIATHLKSGIIEQRTCTTIPNPFKEVRVALASFLVADQTNIIGTVNKVFDEMHGYEVITPLLGSVYSLPINTADELRSPIGFDLGVDE